MNQTNIKCCYKGDACLLTLKHLSSFLIECEGKGNNIHQLVHAKGDVSVTHLILNINIGAVSDESSERLSLAVHCCIMSRSVFILKEIDNGKLEYS